MLLPMRRRLMPAFVLHAATPRHAAPRLRHLLPPPHRRHARLLISPCAAYTPPRLPCRDYQRHAICQIFSTLHGCRFLLMSPDITPLSIFRCCRLSACRRFRCRHAAWHAAIDADAIYFDDDAPDGVDSRRCCRLPPPFSLFSPMLQLNGYRFLFAAVFSAAAIFAFVVLLFRRQLRDAATIAADATPPFRHARRRCRWLDAAFASTLPPGCCRHARAIWRMRRMLSPLSPRRPPIALCDADARATAPSRRARRGAAARCVCGVPRERYARLRLFAASASRARRADGAHAAPSRRHDTPRPPRVCRQRAAFAIISILLFFCFYLRLDAAARR